MELVVEIPNVSNGILEFLRNLLEKVRKLKRDIFSKFDAYPKAPTASRKIRSESKEARFSGRKVAVFRGCLSF